MLLQKTQVNTKPHKHTDMHTKSAQLLSATNATTHAHKFTRNYENKHIHYLQLYTAHTL